MTNVSLLGLRQSHIHGKRHLVTHSEEGKFDGTAFDIGTKGLYDTVYERIVNGTPLPIGPEHGAKIIGVIEAIHAQNPLERKF